MLRFEGYAYFIARPPNTPKKFIGRKRIYPFGPDDWPAIEALARESSNVIVFVTGAVSDSGARYVLEVPKYRLLILTYAHGTPWKLKHTRPHEPLADGVTQLYTGDSRTVAVLMKWGITIDKKLDRLLYKRKKTASIIDVGVDIPIQKNRETVERWITEQ